MNLSLQTYRTEVEHELKTNILPFSVNHLIDRENGGFFGLISNDLQVQSDAPKAGLQCVRILWSYAQAYRIWGDAVYREMADWAYDYLLKNLWDAEFGGTYWMLDYAGQPIETVKMTYVQAFTIYGLAEYHRATGDEASLQRAIELHRLLEAHAFDPAHGGYFEGCLRDWSPGGSQMQLADDCLPAPKSMNTHLHVLEAYTNLLRVWPDDGLRIKQTALLRVMLDHIVDGQTGHFKLFFDEDWRSKSEAVSYGHDIEGSWLLVEAAEVLGDAEMLAQAECVALQMADATLAEGFDDDGGLFYEAEPTGLTNSNKDWWPQAESMVGFFNAYQLTGKETYLQASLRSWEFIKTYLIDRENGEWFWGVSCTREVLDEPKAGPWKAPYHNSRACFEIAARVITTRNLNP